MKAKPEHKSAIRKNTLLLFSKLPEPGLVKTRLTTLKDGVFAPEVASALYHCMLFDVVEICCAALDVLEKRGAQHWEACSASYRETDGAQHGICGEPHRGIFDETDLEDEVDIEERTGSDHILDEYELVISTAPAVNTPKMRELFESAGEWPRPLKFIADQGASFDEHYNDAFDQVWESGTDCIFSMGADMPALTVNDIVRGFEALHRLMDSSEFPNDGLVIAPDQEMGVSAIGWTCNTPASVNGSENVSRETFSSENEEAIETETCEGSGIGCGRFTHTGIYYNQDGLTVLPAYIQKAREAGLPAIYLPPIPDVDTMADLMHNITVVEALNYCAQFDGNTPPWRTANALREMGISEVRVAPNDLRDPRDHIDIR